ncbi:MAG: hypothetical protein LUE99_00485 [Bacteroides sp.]|nr:hypothetical protein [Bacteroides sp.]
MISKIFKKNSLIAIFPSALYWELRHVEVTTIRATTTVVPMMVVKVKM